MGYCGLDARHINEGTFRASDLEVATVCKDYFRWDISSLAVQVSPLIPTA